MSDTIGLEQADDIFGYGVSDEVLEIAGGTRSEIAVRYTLYACTSVDCALVAQ